VSSLSPSFAAILADIISSFLDDLNRIARRDYQPSDDDVVRARLRTLGVQEYRVNFEPSTSIFSGGVGGDAGREWLLYDVGGSRTAVRFRYSISVRF